MWELDCKESWALKDWCFWTVVLENTLESPLECKEIQPVHPKRDQSWGSLEGLMLKLKLQYFGHLMWRTDHLKRPWCWERLKAGREGDDRGWDGWMASLTQWTWVWVDSGSCWWTGRPGVLWFTGLQRIGYDWATELNWKSIDWASQVALLVRNPPPNAGDIRDMGSIPRSGRSPGGEHSNPLPVFLPGEFHGQRSLVGYSP